MASGRSLFLLLLLATISTCQEEEAVAVAKIETITFYDEQTFESLKQKDEVKTSFFLARFSQAEFEPKCQQQPKPIIVPVYFYSGGTVELPCKMCEWTFVVNGEPKTWSHIPLHRASKFLEDPAKFLSDRMSEVQSLKKSLTPEGGGFLRRAHLLKRLYRADANLEGEKERPVPPAQKIASIHEYIQSDGKLYIHGTMLESSGIYFCHDKLSLSSHTRVFFLLTAMAPLVHHTAITGKEEMASLWNVDDWLTSGQKYEPKCTTTDTAHPMPDEFAHMRYSPADLSGGKKQWVTEGPVPISLEKLDYESNLLITHEYGEWTECRDQQSFREVHCVLERKEGTKIPEMPSIAYASWLTSLNAYFDRVPTLRIHSYFLSSMIYKGETEEEYGTDNEGQDGTTCDERRPRIWEAYRHLFLPPLNQMPHSDVLKYFTEQEGDLKDNSCFEIQSSKTAPIWWSIRGISFIEKKSC